MSNYPAQVLDVSFPNFQTRLGDMGQTGQEGEVTNLDLPMSIFFHIWILRGCIMFSLDIHTMSADQL